MRVPLIYVSVIMILSFVTCSDHIEDLSEWCIYGRTRYYNLTSGAEPKDILVSRTATEGNINCTLKFTVKTGNYIMITLQFPVMKEHERVCYIENNTTIILRDYIRNGSCLQRNSTEFPFCRLSKENLSLHFRSDGNMSAVKVSVTAMKDDAVLNCSQNKENGWFVDVKLLHKPHAVVQGHNDSEFVEDPEVALEEPSLSLFVITCSLVMVLITLFLLFSIALHMVPKRKDPYIHAFDQSMSLFDCENGIVTVELNITIIFPPAIK